MVKNNEIIDTSYQEVAKPKYYNVAEASKKLNISTTKVNHWIFKLNKTKSNFFRDATKLTEDDLDKIKLAQEMVDDGRTIEEIVDYFTNESNSLINKDNSVKTDLTRLDSQVLSKALTIEVEKNINKLMDTLENEFTDKITEEFKLQASKIAQSSLQAIEQVRNEMLDEVVKLRKQNDFYRNELERMNNNQIERLRKKLEEKERSIEELKQQQNKSWINKIFNK